MPAMSNASCAFPGTPASNCVLRPVRYDEFCTNARMFMSAMARARAVEVGRTVGGDEVSIPPGEPPGAMLTRKRVPDREEQGKPSEDARHGRYHSLE